MSDVRLDDLRTASVEGLEEIERRLLWLSSYMIHEANKRGDPTGIKVGGHQASSASSVSILTALYFSHLTGADRIAVKPHASPVLYAIQYLLGRIQKEQLAALRSYHGLQAYPSQTKNPDFVDYSTGSMGLGAAAVNFSALAAYFLRARQLWHGEGTFWAVVGDAELDEGNVWEALAEPLLDDVPGIRWVVDLNRQSLDRVVPGIRIHRLKQLFEANGWRVIEAKYGRILSSLFEAEGGNRLRQRIDEMANEEFQDILSGPSEAIAARLGEGVGKATFGLLSSLSPRELRLALTDLGGHDQVTLARSFKLADAEPSPAVIFAYTVKGWRLPFAGDALNHSALMSDGQFNNLLADLGIQGDPLAHFEPGSAAGDIVKAAQDRLARPRNTASKTATVPVSLETSYTGSLSTQEVFGRSLKELATAFPDVAGHVVTAAPDVSISTNLAGWINRVGIWRATPPPRYSDAPRLLRWDEGPQGQHLELGISEMNLLGLITQLGLSGKNFGFPLAPIGTVYDTFVSRGLDGLVYGLYCGSSFILIGTPSGVSLAPEGGAHQSTFTPGLGVSLPDLISYEPCFAKEVEWILLDSIDRALSQRGSTYIRLSTLPAKQDRFPSNKHSLRDQVLRGAYRLVDRREEPDYSPNHAVLVFASGVTLPGACEASDLLLNEGVFASVMNVTSADRLFARWDEASMATIDQASHQPNPFPDLLSEEEIGIPALVVADGHPHNLAFLGAALKVSATSMGVSGFGESGTVADLFRKHRLTPEAIVNAAIALVDRPNSGT